MENQLRQSEFMKFERIKAINQATTQVDNALNTFYDGDTGFKDLKEIERLLKEFKQNHF